MTFQTPSPIFAQDSLSRLSDALRYGVSGQDVAVLPAPQGADGEVWRIGSLPADAPTLSACSAPLRNASAALGTLIADVRIAGAMAALGVLKAGKGPVTIVLPCAEVAPDSTNHLASGVRARVVHRTLMLREARRQALGLSAKLPVHAIDAAIWEAYVLPGVRDVLQSASLVPVHVVAESDAPTDHEFAPMRADHDAPLSSNVFALAIRMGHFGPVRKSLKSIFRTAPHQLGNALRRSGRATEGDVRAAMAICGFHLSHSTSAQSQEVSHA